MVRLLGIVLPDEKRVEYALTLYYGIGWARSRDILKQTSIDTHTKVKDLKEEELKKIVALIEKNFKIEGDLREEIADNIKRFREIGSYRGSRHSKGLPVRGQRTRRNARTKRGKRKTVGALKKETWAKMEQAAAQKPAAPAAKK